LKLREEVAGTKPPKVRLRSNESLPSVYERILN